VNASEAVLEENIANLWINDLDHHTDVALLKKAINTILNVIYWQNVKLQRAN
jgi:hypothetical protein